MGKKGNSNRSRRRQPSEQHLQALLDPVLALGKGTIAFYHRLGRLGVALVDGDAQIINDRGVPATLDDLMAEVGFGYNMAAKCVRFARRFDAKALKLVLQEWHDKKNRMRSFKWAHIDALLSLGEGMEKERDRLIRETIQNSWPATRLMKEVRKVNGTKSKTAGGRPLQVRRHLGDLRKTLRKARTEIATAEKCVAKHDPAAKGDASAIAALQTDLESTAKAIDKLLRAMPKAKRRSRKK